MARLQQVSHAERKTTCKGPERRKIFLPCCGGSGMNDGHVRTSGGGNAGLIHGDMPVHTNTQYHCVDYAPVSDKILRSQAFSTEISPLTIKKANFLIPDTQRMEQEAI